MCPLGSGGVMLLPVSTAGDLVDAIARHTPWAPDAARMARFGSLPRREGGLAGPVSPALSRKLAVAGIASPLLPPARASAAAAWMLAWRSIAGPAPSPPTRTPHVRDQTLATSPPSTVPPNSQPAFLNRIESAFQYYLQQTGQNTTSNTQAMQTLENRIMRLVNAFINAQPRTSAQSAQAASSPQTGSAGRTNAGSQGAGSAGSQGSGAQGRVGSSRPGRRTGNNRRTSRETRISRTSRVRLRRIPPPHRAHVGTGSMWGRGLRRDRARRQGKGERRGKAPCPRAGALPHMVRPVPRRAAGLPHLAGAVPLQEVPRAAAAAVDGGTGRWQRQPVGFPDARIRCSCSARAARVRRC